MEMFPRESPFSFGEKLPFEVSGRGIHRVEPAAVGSEINDSVVDRRRSRCPYTQREFPFLRAGFEIESVEIPVRTGYVGRAIYHRGRRNHLAAGLKLPFDPAELRYSDAL